MTGGWEETGGTLDFGLGLQVHSGYTVVYSLVRPSENLLSGGMVGDHGPWSLDSC